MRGLLAGALLAIPLTVDWLYALLLAAAWWVPAADARPAVRRGLAVGAAAMLAAICGVQWSAGGGLPFAASRYCFTAASGYPLVDFPATEWASSIRHLESLAAGSSFTWDPELRLWAVVDLLLGRGIGLLPYFAPLLLVAAGGSSRDFRRPIVLAAGVWLAAVAVLRPFDVAGGQAALANPSFVPLYGALWLVVDRHRRPRRWLAGGGAAVLVAVLFMGELWRDPAAGRDAGGGHQTVASRRWLPYETTQRGRVGAAAIDHGGLRIEAVGDAAWVETRRRRVVADGAGVELVVSARRPLTAVRLEFEGSAVVAAELRARGGRIEPIADPSYAGRAATLVLGGLRRRHAGWSSPGRDYRYVVALEWPTSAAPRALRVSEATAR